MKTSILQQVVHFDQETSRFSNLGEGKCALHNSHGTVRVALIRRLPATFIGQLRERFLGGDPFLKGIVLNQVCEGHHIIAITLMLFIYKKGKHVFFAFFF